MYRQYRASWVKHLDFLLIDLFVLQVSSFFAYFVCFGTRENYFSDVYLRITLLLLMLNSCVAFFNESYHSILRRGYWQEAKESAKHILLIMAFLITYLYFTKQSWMLPRAYLLWVAALSFGLLYLMRCAYKILLQHHREKNQEASYYMLVLASAANIDRVLSNLEGGGYRINGICLADADKTGEYIKGIPVIASMDRLLDHIKENVVDGLFIDLPEGIPIPENILTTCINMGVSTHIGLVAGAQASDGQVIERIGKYTVLTNSVRIASVGQLFIKRVFDICAGLIGVIVTGIAFLFVAPAIYAASPGPIFFSQIRVGRNGRKFKIYKFRSMYMDAEERKKELMRQNKIADGMMFKMDDDPRIIKGIGHFIRNYSIDELPQLWNVLKGEMSLIGTRPPTVEEYEKYHYHHKIRLAIKPGITGMWQVSGRSNITDFEQVVALDASYITNWSLALDLKILFKTMKVVLNREGAV